MDGNISPIHRKHRKCIYGDLYSSTVTIFIVEVAILSSWFVYYTIMLQSYHENGGKTTQDAIDEENGEDITEKVTIPQDVIYYFLLIGFGYSVILSVLLFLGTCWLFTDFLRLWNYGSIISTVYLFVVLMIDWIFTRHTLPIELLYLPVRCYFFFVVFSFIDQITDDITHEIDYKKYAQEYFLETGTKFVSTRPVPRGDFCKFCCAMFCCDTLRRTNKIAPIELSDRKTIIRNMRRDMQLDTQSIISLQNTQNSPELVTKEKMDTIPVLSSSPPNKIVTPVLSSSPDKIMIPAPTSPPDNIMISAPTSSPDNIMIPVPTSPPTKIMIPAPTSSPADIINPVVTESSNSEN